MDNEVLSDFKRILYYADFKKGNKRSKKELYEHVLC